MTPDEKRWLTFGAVLLLASGLSGFLRANLEAAGTARWLLDLLQWQTGFIVGAAYSWTQWRR